MSLDGLQSGVEGERLKVLLITSAPRSGSTILDIALNQAEGVFGAGEFESLWKRTEHARCGCGQLRSECAFWPNAVEKAFGHRDVARVQRRFQPLASIYPKHIELLRVGRGRDWWETRVAPLRTDLERFYRAMAETAGARVIVDSSKSASHGWVLDSLPGIDLYVLHLMRDPRGLAYSWRKVVRDSDGEMPRYGSVMVSGLWMQYDRWARRLIEHLPGKAMQLRYEDLMADPPGRLGSILELVGERPESMPLINGREFETTANHALAGNPVRLKKGRTVLREDRAWETALPAWRKAVVSLLTSPGLRRNGYPVLPLRRESGEAGGDR